MQQQNWQFQHSYAQLPSDFFELQQPTPVQNPKVLLLNNALVKDLGVDYLLEDEQQTALHLSGNSIPENALPLAQAYAGHQFGYFNMLGDGRAILLGEHIAPNHQRFDIQLKGAGQTVFSRRGDGRATLRSMLREYLISEAMFFLRIPTSRSLAVVGTDDFVYREHPHKGAILTRVMSSHIRVGTFEFARQFCSVNDLATFTNYVIDRHYPECKADANPVLSFFKTIVKKQTDLIIHWMRVGFIHGVMNTDNTSIAGETFDYGPCAFMNAFHPQTVFSSIDTNGRYAYQNQPSIIKWNLHVLANALLPLLHETESEALLLAQKVLDDFDDYYVNSWYKMMFDKIGISDANDADKPLVNELLHWMFTNKADFTNTFQLIMKQQPLSTNHEGLQDWLEKWNKRIQSSTGGMLIALALMQANNPFVIPRNHIVEAALDAAVSGDFSVYHQLLSILQKPYEQQMIDEKFISSPSNFDVTYKTFCGT